MPKGASLSGAKPGEDRDQQADRSHMPKKLYVSVKVLQATASNSFMSISCPVESATGCYLHQRRKAAKAQWHDASGSCNARKPESQGHNSQGTGSVGPSQ